MFVSAHEGPHADTLTCSYSEFSFRFYAQFLGTTKRETSETPVFPNQCQTLLFLFDVKAEAFFLLAKLLSVRCAPDSERATAKECKEAKGNRKQKTEPENNKQQKPNKKPNTTNTTNPYAAGETCETGET